MSEWQLIETVPKDGTVVMISVKSHRHLPYICRADDYWHGAWWLETATHWMPLPPPPEQNATET